MGAGLAASGAAADRHRIVPGGVLGRAVAGAAVAWARRSGSCLFMLLALRRGTAAGLVSLAEPRAGTEPARSRLRYRAIVRQPRSPTRSRRRTRSRSLCGRRSASARWLRSSASAPACRRRDLRLYDPWALRGLVAVMLVAAFFAAGDERTLRLASAFDWNGVLTPTNIRVDAWVNPPAYTGKPPIILSAANKEAAALPMSGPLRGAGRLDADRALERRHARRDRRRRRHRSCVDRAGAEGHQREALHHCRRRHRACARALRPAAMEVHRDARPPADDLAGQGSGAAGARLAADGLQDRGRLRRHRSPRRSSQTRPAEGGKGPARAAAVQRRRSSRWCCRMRAPATASARP